MPTPPGVGSSQTAVSPWAEQRKLEYERQLESRVGVLEQELEAIHEELTQPL